MFKVEDMNKAEARENTVVLNGVALDNVTDEVAEMIYKLTKGQSISAPKKVACKWSIEKRTVGKKAWFTIENGIYANRKSGKGDFTSKRKANALALELESKGGTKVELDAGTYKYFRIGFPTEAKAKAAIATLPEYIEG